MLQVYCNQTIKLNLDECPILPFKKKQQQQHRYITFVCTEGQTQFSLRSQQTTTTQLKQRD